VSSDTSVPASRPSDVGLNLPEDESFSIAIQHAIARRKRRTASRWILGIVVPLLFLGLWELTGRFGLVDTRFIPPPSQVLQQMVDGIRHENLADELGRHGLDSLMRFVPGFFIGGFAGLVVGMFIGLFDPVRFGLGPIVSATFPLPKIAIYPIVIVLFGVGEASKIVIVAIGVFYMVCVNTASGVMYSNPVYRDVATSFQLPRWKEYVRIVLPAAAPSIMTGVRLGVGVGLIVVISAEFVAAQSGIGFYIWNSWQVLNIDGMFSGLVVVAVFGVLANWALDMVEQWLIPWSDQ
jgi:NitT/TauT family transport system permease protein